MSDWTEIEIGFGNTSGISSSISYKSCARVCKAEALGSFKKITDQVIVIKGQIPERMTLDECKKFHERQALMINNALRESLPQGTYDRLGIMFMQHKVSLYQGRTESAS